MWTPHCVPASSRAVSRAASRAASRARSLALPRLVGTTYLFLSYLD